jgi:hypothetical protein
MINLFNWSGKELNKGVFYAIDLKNKAQLQFFSGVLLMMN